MWQHLHYRDFVPLHAQGGFTSWVKTHWFISFIQFLPWLEDPTNNNNIHKWAMPSVLCCLIQNIFFWSEYLLKTGHRAAAAAAAAAVPSLSHKDSSYAWLLQKINYSSKHLDFVLFIKKCHDAQPKGFKGLFLGSTCPQNIAGAAPNPIGRPGKVSSRVVLPRSLGGWASEQL